MILPWVTDAAGLYFPSMMESSISDDPDLSRLRAMIVFGVDFIQGRANNQNIMDNKPFMRTKRNPGVGDLNMEKIMASTQASVSS
jgi:hypothetical protein